MIFTPPVVYEFEIRVETLLLIGDADRTAPDSNRAPPDVAARLGNYPELARRAAQAIPMPGSSNFPNLTMQPRSKHRRPFIRRCQAE
jgi:hypothetical protein